MARWHPATAISRLLPLFLGILGAWVAAWLAWLPFPWATDLPVRVAYGAAYAVPGCFLLILVCLLLRRHTFSWRWALGMGLPVLVGLATLPSGEVRVPLVAVTPPRCRVELLAIDGMDPGEAARLLKRGVLPNLQRLLDEGRSAPLQTISPHSPLVWTSVATGRPPPVHGVLSYTSARFRGRLVPAREPLGDLLEGIFPWREIGPVSSEERRVLALWNLLGDVGQTGLVVNWWATWPAEDVSGTLISNEAIPWDSFSPAAVAALGERERLVTPARETGPVLETVRQFAEDAESRHIIRDAFTPEGAKYFLDRDRLAWRLFRERWNSGVSFGTVYLQGIDTASHAWTSVVYGKNVNKVREKRVTEAEAEALWEELVGSAWRAMDARIGEALDSIREDASGADTCLVLSSDHGWRYDGTSHWTEPDGFFAATGGPFSAAPASGGAVLPEAGIHIYDLFPTFATLLGIPLSAELPGTSRVPGGSQVPGNTVPAGNTVPGGILVPGNTVPAGNTVPRYGARTRVAPVTGADEDAGHVERLRALGYVE